MTTTMNKETLAALIAGTAISIFILGLSLTLTNWIRATDY